MKVAVIGAGFGGLSAAAYLAKAGCEVHVFEQNDWPGGRAMVYERGGYRFDTGPGWYLMPEVFEQIFADFGKRPDDYYELIQLQPSYGVFFEDDYQAVRPAPAVYKDFDEREPGAGRKLSRYLEQTEREYKKVYEQLLSADRISLRRVAGPAALDVLLTPRLLGSFHQRIAGVVQDDKLRQILEFVTNFVGGSPKTVPGFYGLLNWADFGQGSWYPRGGFGAVVKAFAVLAEAQGAVLHYGSAVDSIAVEGSHARAITVGGQRLEFSAIVAAADYCHVETELLPDHARSYGKKFWQDKTLSPSAVVGLLGVSRKLPLPHHSLFFDAPWQQHFNDVFDKHQVGERPLFLVTAPSRTDVSAAPAGCENLTVVVPVSNRAEISHQLAGQLIDQAIGRIEKNTGVMFRQRLAVKEVLPPSHFGDRFNACRNSAYGLSHTLLQSGPMRPPSRSKKVFNLYYAGQYTAPGTTVAWTLLSGRTAAGLVTGERR